jgi:hypothetical protein
MIPGDAKDPDPMDVCAVKLIEMFTDRTGDDKVGGDFIDLGHPDLKDEFAVELIEMLFGVLSADEVIFGVGIPDPDPTGINFVAKALLNPSVKFQ